MDQQLVAEFVGNAHGDLNRVKELLAGEPGLINATWDWGGGDFETALGAASHMGRRDIAEFLLANGARLDIFAAAMLGHFQQVEDAEETRGAGQLGSDIREADRLNGVNLDVTAFHRVANSEGDVRMLPEPHATGDFTPADALAQALGEEHAGSLHGIREWKST